MGVSSMELLTAAEIEAAYGLNRATIRTEQRRGQWPEPDARIACAALWKPSTVARAIANREERANG